MAGTESVRLEHSRALDASVASVWRALLDAELIAGCVADASITSTDDGVAAGRLKVRFGPVNPTYRVTGQVRERNRRAHRVVLAIDGTDTRGTGTLAAIVAVTVRRSGDATIVRIEADVEITGRPAELSEARRRAAGQRMIEQFADELSKTISEGDAVADQPAEDPPAADAAGSARKRPKPTPAAAHDAETAQRAAPITGAAPQPPDQVSDDPTTVEPAPDVVPADLFEEPVQESAIDSAVEPAIDSAAEPAIDSAAEPAIDSAAEPTIDTAAAAAVPSFSTPEVIPVPSLHDEPSVNGHPPASAALPDESPLATSTRQAIAKRVAPVALGLVFVLAAARRRRGKRP